MANLTAVGHKTAELLKQRNEGFAVSISGTFVGTVDVQRSFDDGATWLTISQYTGPKEIDGEFSVAAKLRAYLSAYTSGTAVVNVY